MNLIKKLKWQWMTFDNWVWASTCTKVSILLSEGKRIPFWLRFRYKLMFWVPNPIQEIRNQLIIRRIRKLEEKIFGKK